MQDNVFPDNLLKLEKEKKTVQKKLKIMNKKFEIIERNIKREKSKYYFCTNCQRYFLKQKIKLLTGYIEEYIFDEKSGTKRKASFLITYFLCPDCKEKIILKKIFSSFE